MRTLENVGLMYIDRGVKPLGKAKAQQNHSFSNDDVVDSKRNEDELLLKDFGLFNDDVLNEMMEKVIIPL
ncbi:hypothetical protein LXL04_032662 [Taraxacum kok-saghyz]